MQKRAARVILNAKYDVPSLKLFMKLGWLTIRHRIEYHKGVLVFNCLNDLAPEYLCNMFNKCHNSSYSLGSTTNGNLFIQRPNTNFLKRSFQYSGSLLWKILRLYRILIKKYMDYLLMKQNSDV